MPRVHVYSAAFPDEDAAMAYMEESYDDDGNASCAFWDAIGADWLDHDFIEVIYGNGRFDYLTPYLVRANEIETVRGRSRPADDTLLLVFVVGADNAAFTPRPTPEPLYIGTFEAQIPVPEPRPKKFDFYEVVRISHPDLPDGCLGYIAGISQDEQGVYGYGVWVDAAGEVWSLDEEHLTSTGEFVPEEDARSGITLQVSQEGELLGVTVGPEAEAPVHGDNFIIMRDRTDWFSAYTKRIDAGVMEPEQPGVTYPCPCCGYPTLPERGGYSICFLCDWEDDGQDDPSADEVWGGPNGSYSLTQARSNFAEFGIMYSPGDHGTPETEAVRQAKRAVCAAYEALRSAGPDATAEFLEGLEEARRRLEEERRRGPRRS